MADLKFVGGDEVLNISRLNLIRSVLEKRGFKDEKVIVEDVGKVGDNYVAYVKRIVVKKEGEEPFSMIAKIAPSDEYIRLKMSTQLLFSNEIVIYSKLHPLLNDLFENNDVPRAQRCKFPVLYGLLHEAPNEIILLEDLTVSQFQMLDRFKPLTNEYVKIALKDLAIYHSLSFVLKENQPDKFEEIKKTLLPFWVLMDRSDDLKMFLSVLQADAIQLLDNERYKNALKGVLSSLTTMSKQLHGNALECKHSVIQQGDCWHNNILYRLEDGVPVESVMIDYQISKISNPAEDILYLTFNCSDHETRLKHFNEWIDYYHTELDASLSNFNLKATRVYPRDQLDTDLRRYTKLSLGLSVLLASVLLREAEEIIDVKNEEGNNVENVEKLPTRLIDLSDKTKERFKARVAGCIDTALNLGLITLL